MFILSAEKSKFYKIKRGQTKREVSLFLSRPIAGECFSGRIIPADTDYTVCIANAGETFFSLSQKWGVPENELKELNGGIIYPGCKILVPHKN